MTDLKIENTDVAGSLTYPLIGSEWAALVTPLVLAGDIVISNVVVIGARRVQVGKVVSYDMNISMTMVSPTNVETAGYLSIENLGGNIVAGGGKMVVTASPMIAGIVNPEPPLPNNALTVTIQVPIPVAAATTFGLCNISGSYVLE